MIYLVVWRRDRKRDQPTLAPWKFLACTLADMHGSLFMIVGYKLTTITSVLLLQDFTIPSALFLSMCILKVKYMQIHMKALFLCAIGMGVSLYNDIVGIVRPNGDHGRA